jgi:hypothetical protein
VTKTLILKELEQEACVVVQALVLQWDLVAELLQSPDLRIRQYTCNILRTLATSYDSTSWGTEVSACIVSLLRCVMIVLCDSYLSWHPK